MTDAEFTRLLISHGLIAAGTSETIHELERRYGSRRWFGFADVTDLPPASLFPEQTEPFFFYANRTCLLPPVELECDFDYYRDGPRTHACALDRLTAAFGAPVNGVAVNTLCQTWKFERASLTIRTFLRDKTPSRSPLYEKHPELWNHCRITIDRNWIRPMTEAEAAALNAIEPRQMLPVERDSRPAIEHMSMWERGLFRVAEPGVIARPDTSPFLWRQDKTIGWRAGTESAIFERSSCLSLTLLRALPDRSPGYSKLELQLKNPFSLQQEPVGTVILAGKQAHTLDLASPAVAAFWQLPLRTEEFRDD